MTITKHLIGNSACRSLYIAWWDIERMRNDIDTAYELQALFHA